MKKTALFALIVALVIGLYAAYQRGRENARPKITRHDEVAEKYEVLNADGWKSALIQAEVWNEWKVALKSGARLTVKTDGNNVFTCDGRKAEFLPYYSYSAPNSLGGWDSASVVDCGSQYFVYEYGDGGPHLFGPFNLTTK